VTGDAGLAKIKPFVADLFNGALCIFLLDMGLVAVRQGRAARNCRQRRDLCIGDRTHSVVRRQHPAGLGHIKAVIAFEAPGVEANRQVVGKEIVTRKIEIDQAGKPVTEEKDIVGKEVRMTDANG
ncbi:MAG: sodium-dependent bicarbonate transport family permease, partial [Rickettsiales bacterium]